MRRRSRPPVSLNYGEQKSGGRTIEEWRKLNAARAIEAGEAPFRFWSGQVTIGLDAVAKRTGIARERLLALDAGEGIATSEEAEALALVLRCEPSDLIAGR